MTLLTLYIQGVAKIIPNFFHPHVHFWKPLMIHWWLESVRLVSMFSNILPCSKYYLGVNTANILIWLYALNILQALNINYYITFPFYFFYFINSVASSLSSSKKSSYIFIRQHVYYNFTMFWKWGMLLLSRIVLSSYDYAYGRASYFAILTFDTKDKKEKFLSELRISRLLEE